MGRKRKKSCDKSRRKKLLLLLERGQAGTFLPQEMHARHPLPHPTGLSGNGHPQKRHDAQHNVLDAEAEPNHVTPHAQLELLVHRTVGAAVP